MIILARQKPVEQLPEWALCCETLRQLHVAAAELGRIVHVESGSTFSGELECHNCHRITQNIRYMLTVGRKKYAIAVDNYDFDEGPHSEP